MSPFVASAQDASAADAAFASKRYADAIPLYLQVVQKSSDPAVRARAQMQIGWAYYYLSDRKQAQTEWVRLADLFPDRPADASNALLRAGNSAAGGNDPAGAAGFYKRAADSYTDSAEARQYAVQARCWLGNAHIKLAESKKRAASDDARSRSITITGAEVWKQAEADFRAAEEAYSSVIQDFPEAGKLLTEAEMLLISLKMEYAIYVQGATYEDVCKASDAFLAKWPDDAVRRPTVLMMRAESLFYLNRFDEALADLATIQGQYASTARESLGTSLFFSARCLEEKNETEGAVEAYRKYLDASIPKFNQRLLDAQAWLFLGCCLQRLGRIHEALGAFDVILETLPDCPVAETARLFRDALGRREGVS
jgi:tetratricopeptide (TPR) repeat protein